LYKLSVIRKPCKSTICYSYKYKYIKCLYN